MASMVPVGLRVLALSMIFIGAALLADVGTVLAQDSSSPIAAENPIIPQHIAVVGYVDSDSLGNRTVYGDATFAPFSGIYESGVRFRAVAFLVSVTQSPERVPQACVGGQICGA